MPKSKKAPSKKATKKASAKNSLVGNINRSKKAQKSRSKKDSTVSNEAYQEMKEGWPKKKSSKAASKSGATKKSASSKGKATKARGTKTKTAKSKKAKRPSSSLKDPQGGLTAAGRKAFKEKDGSNLRPGVKGPADTPDKMRRKGSFLRRHYTTLRGPLVDDEGNPTRLALQAHAWGEPVPKTAAEAKKLAKKGKKLLEQYHDTKAKKSDTKGRS